MPRRAQKDQSSPAQPPTHPSRTWLTCPRSRVTLTWLNSSPRDSGGLCHQRSVPSMALVMGCALLLFAEEQMSQYWPWWKAQRQHLMVARKTRPTVPSSSPSSRATSPWLLCWGCHSQPCQYPEILTWAIQSSLQTQAASSPVQLRNLFLVNP